MVAALHGFSFTNGWGDNPKAFFNGEFPEGPQKPWCLLDFNMNVLIPMVLVWGVLLAVMALGVQKGVGAANIIFIPLLLVMFVGLVIYSADPARCGRWSECSVHP